MSGSLNRKHELSVMNVFMSRSRKVAEREGKRFIGAPLDGQDAWLGADCLMSEGSRFAMAECKYEESDIRSENRKPRRLAMCKALLRDSARLSEHVVCHLMAWSVCDERRTIVFNGYSNEVCNAQVWGDQHGLGATTCPDPRQEDELFKRMNYSLRRSLPARLVWSLMSSRRMFRGYLILRTSIPPV